MIPVAEAEAIVLDRVQPFVAPRDAETVPLDEALGRILAETARSRLDFPHWDNSAMDGYAVRSADWDGTGDAAADVVAGEAPQTLRVVLEIPAGTVPARAIGPGEAARLFTGSMMPAGADAVVMQEDTEREGDRLRALRRPEPGAFVRRRGDYRRAGDPVVAAGTRLGPAELAVLAAAQQERLAVFRRPRVTVLSTGDELVPLGQPLQPGQIVDSNRYALTAFVRQAGAVPLAPAIVPDDPDALAAAIARARDEDAADLVLSSGGVSVGDYDFVERILERFDARIALRAVAVRPGKPLTVATLPRPSDRPPLLYFGLPGNPASALTSCWRFVAPALRKLSGRSGDPRPQFLHCPTRSPLKGAGRRETYLWGKLQPIAGGYAFERAAGSTSSGNLADLAGTEALAVVPQGTPDLPEGAIVRVLPVGGLG